MLLDTERSRRMIRVHISIQEFLFYFAFIIYLVVSLIGASFFYKPLEGKPTILLLTGSILLLFLREIIIDDIPTSTLPLIMLCLLLGLIMVKNSPAKTSAFFVAYIYACRNMDFRKLAKFSAIISLVLLCGIFLCSLAGIIPNIYDIWSGRPRYYLGFRYALFPSTILFNIIALTLYYKGRECSWRLLILLGTVNYGMFFLTDSRLCYYTG